MCFLWVKIDLKIYFSDNYWGRSIIKKSKAHKMGFLLPKQVTQIFFRSLEAFQTKLEILSQSVVDHSSGIPAGHVHNSYREVCGRQSDQANQQWSNSDHYLIALTLYLKDSPLYLKLLHSCPCMDMTEVLGLITREEGSNLE